jgi:hypothetical protein
MVLRLADGQRPARRQVIPRFYRANESKRRNHITISRVTCAHSMRWLSPYCHVETIWGGCLYPKFKSMKNIAFFYW